MVGDFDLSPLTLDLSSSIEVRRYVESLLKIAFIYLRITFTDGLRQKNRRSDDERSCSWTYPLAWQLQT